MRIRRDSYLDQGKKFMHIYGEGVVFVGVIPFLLDSRIVMGG